MSRRKQKRAKREQEELGKGRREAETLSQDDPRVQPDWEHECEVCGQKPVLPLTGMCGPCTFGESETAGGNW